MKIHHNMNQDSWRINMVDTGEKAMEGARVKRLQKFIPDDTFMVTYGDGVADLDIKALVAFHNKHGQIATVTEINPAARFGELMLDGNVVINFREKHLDDGGLTNGGFLFSTRKYLIISHQMIIAIWKSAPGENCRGKATNGISTYRLLGLYGYLTWYGLSQQPMGKKKALWKIWQF